MRPDRKLYFISLEPFTNEVGNDHLNRVNVTKEEFIALYEMCLSGNCSDEELKSLEQFQDDFELARHPWSTEHCPFREYKK